MIITPHAEHALTRRWFPFLGSVGAAKRKDFFD